MRVLITVACFQNGISVSERFIAMYILYVVMRTTTIKQVNAALLLREAFAANASSLCAMSAAQAMPTVDHYSTTVICAAKDLSPRSYCREGHQC